MKRKIYVASSWRNEYYPEVVEKLRMNDHEGRRARERQREGLARRAEGESQRSGNCSNETNTSFHNNKYRLAKI